MALSRSKYKGRLGDLKVPLTLGTWFSSEHICLCNCQWVLTLRPPKCRLTGLSSGEDGSHGFSPPTMTLSALAHLLIAHVMSDLCSAANSRLIKQGHSHVCFIQGSQPISERSSCLVFTCQYASTLKASKSNCSQHLSSCRSAVNTMERTGNKVKSIINLTDIYGAECWAGTEFWVL